MLQDTGRVDGLINNAWCCLSGAVEEPSIEEAHAQFDTNFFGLARVVNEVLPTIHDQKSGRVINIRSVVGFLPTPYMGYYSASKHAVEGYRELLGYELRTLKPDPC